MKSDDTIGRVNTYESIVKGENLPNPSIPESFRVLMKELQSLGLEVSIMDDEDNEVNMNSVVEEDVQRESERAEDKDEVVTK